MSQVFSSNPPLWHCTGGRAYGINIFGQIHSRLTNQTVYKTVRLAPKYKTLSWNIFPHFKYLIFFVIYLNEAFRSESLPGVDHKINWVMSTIQNSLDIFWELLRLIMNSILPDNFVQYGIFIEIVWIVIPQLLIDKEFIFTKNCLCLV